jgi:hypothetical protein
VVLWDGQRGTLDSPGTDRGCGSEDRPHEGSSTRKVSIYPRGGAHDAREYSSVARLTKCPRQLTVAVVLSLLVLVRSSLRCPAFFVPCNNELVFMLSPIHHFPCLCFECCGALLLATLLAKVSPFARAWLGWNNFVTEVENGRLGIRSTFPLEVTLSDRSRSTCDPASICCSAELHLEE